MALAVALAGVLLIGLAHARLILRSEPLSPSRPHGVLSCALTADREARDPYCAPVPPGAPLLRLARASTGVFGRDYDGVMAAQIALLGLLLAAAAVAARREAGLWAAPVAVFLLGLAPMTTAMTTGFDDHLFNTLALAVALALVSAADAGKWTIPVSAFAIGLAAQSAFLFSNGLLLIAPWACALAGSIADRAASSRAGKSAAARTASTTAAVFAAVGIALAFLWSAPGVEGGSGAGHVREQIVYWTARAWSQTFAEWTAYIRLAVRDLWGPAASLAVALGFYGLHAVRHRSRWMWTAAAFAVPLALTLVAKRNGYYLYTSLTAALMGASVGLAAWATSGARRLAVAGLLSAAVAFSAPGLVLRERLWPRGDWSGVFEGEVYAHGVAPDDPAPRDPSTDAALDRLAAAYRETGRPGDATVYFLSNLDLDDLPRFHLLTRFPRFSFRTIVEWDPADPASRAALLLAWGDALVIHGDDAAAYIESTARFIESVRGADAPEIHRIRALSDEADHWRPLDPGSPFRLFAREPSASP